MVFKPILLLCAAATSGAANRACHACQQPATAADLTLVFDGGSIIEAGSHAELLQRGGMYAAMWQRQLEGAASFSQQTEGPAAAAAAAVRAAEAPAAEAGGVPDEAGLAGGEQQLQGGRDLGHQLSLSRATSQAFTDGNEVEEEDSGEQPGQTPSP